MIAARGLLLPCRTIVILTEACLVHDRIMLRHLRGLDIFPVMSALATRTVTLLLDVTVERYRLNVGLIVRRLTRLPVMLHPTVHPPYLNCLKVPAITAVLGPLAGIGLLCVPLLHCLRLRMRLMLFQDRSVIELGSLSASPLPLR
nr:hypothetical protein [Martellivirales sp.]